MHFDFKAMVDADRRSTFLDLAVFGEEHRVEGVTITAILDDDALRERQGGQELSVAESSLLLFAAVEDLPPRRPAGEGLNIDGREYIINDWREDMGIATVTLGQTVTM
ncbi:MAG: sugar ABC transporter ATP-binding protein [Candidatus Spyradocola sp.]